MKLKNAFTHKLMVIMVGFGIIIGIVFPFFVMFVLRLPSSVALTPMFFALCILAGLLVGAFNFFVFKRIIYDFLELISTKLAAFQEKLSHARRDEAVTCNSEECLIDQRTADPIVGEISNSFNDFILTIQNFMRAEMITNKFIEELKQGLSVKDIADVVLDAFLQYFGGDGGCIIAYDRGQFEILKTLHSVVDVKQFDEKELYRIMDAKEPALFDHLSGNPLKLNIVVGELVPNSIAFVPLKYQDQNIGIAMLIARNAFSRPFDTIEGRNFVNQATPFLYNSSLIRRLEVLAAIDELTGVLNRRFGMKRLQEEFSRAQRYATSFSLCLLDLDHFKNVNDTYGHQAGDEVLRSLAVQLQKELRTSDFVVRYGGEEFLVVLPGASMADAFGIMDRIRRRIETYRLQYGSYTVAYTFSGGICSYPAKDVDDPNDLVRLADDALYQAKNTGRNKIMTADLSERKVAC
jgi:two-component system, cell cycle response regulator